MRCKRCGARAVIDVRRHRAAFCADCFAHHIHEQVRRTIEKFHMVGPGERILVAVSGGKDSLALWDVLLDLGYDADGAYLGLGIGEYSEESREFAQQFATARGAKLHEIEVADAAGFTIPEASNAVHRPTCSVCGLSKRHLLNQVALAHGYDVLATGHNLDDEAAVLFGNVLQWSVDYLARQQPVLPASEGFVRRIKPLVRVAERESAAYCVVRHIDYIVDECPMAAGNKHLRYKETLAAIEERTPGAKATFYLGFLERMLPQLADLAEEERATVGSCARCGAPTSAEVCAFCRLVDRASGDAVSGGEGI